MRLRFLFLVAYSDVEIEREEGDERILIFNTDIYAALALRLRGYRPCLVMAMPRSRIVHQAWLNEDFKWSSYSEEYVCC